MKDCILLVVKQPLCVLADWEYIVTLNGIEHRKALSQWFDYNYNDLPIYVLRNNKISEILSIHDKSRFDELLLEGLPIVDETCRGLKILSYMDLMIYIADISGYSYVKSLGFNDLDSKDYDEYRDTVLKKWGSPYLINPFILYELNEFGAPEDFEKYWCSQKENPELSETYHWTRLGYYAVYLKLWYADLYNIFSEGKELEFKEKLNEYRIKKTEELLKEPFWNFLGLDFDTYVLRYLMNDFLIKNSYSNKEPLFKGKNISKCKLIINNNSKFAENKNRPNLKLIVNNKID